MSKQKSTKDDYEKLNEILRKLESDFEKLKIQKGKKRFREQNAE